MTADSSAEPNLQRLRALEQTLGARESVRLFGHAAVTMILAIIGAGAAGKLFWDLPGQKVYFGLPPAALVLLLVGYSVSRYARGKATAAVELEQFARLKQLRQSMSLDDPSARLPS